MTEENFAVRIAQAKLATKVNFVSFAKKTDFASKIKVINKKVTSNKTKHLEAERNSLI